MKRHILLLLIPVMTVTLALARQNQVSRPDGKLLSYGTIDKTIRQLMDTADVTGLCLGVINNNSIAYIQAYGYKNPGKDQLLDTATVFYAASLAKPVFAYLVMQLTDEGKLDLDKPLYTYLPRPIPEYSEYSDLANDDRWKLITARHCLSHTTGFPNWRFLNPNNNNKLEIFFIPGSRYAYSGEGLVLLQLVIETITGKSLEDLAQERIFRPMNMRRTSFVWQSSFETNYAIGFNSDGIPLEKRKRTTANAAGSMETTIADYTRFLTAVLQGKDISTQTKQEMFAPQIAIYSKHQFPSLTYDSTDANRDIALSYGLGWGLFTSPYGKVFFKEGHDDGWEHYTISFPEKQSAYIIMTNSSNGESIFKELVQKLTGVTIPWEWEGYTPYRTVIHLPPQALEKFTGVYDGQFMQATISLVNGQLKIKAPNVGLPKCNLYAENDHHFFIKLIDADFEFIKDSNNNIEKVIVDGQGEHFELKKIK